ncbi:hypothetical protein K4A83_18650 [Spirulina subsalsa FACHB-351]|uniref:Uncharacterized protein n=2 Tax=Spirulina subsalsa TaxID=54311 RepID=A0ABT3L9U8_9CYAN|nr:hypothetical protein [Spirulina subsalsa FACHB-351]
MQDKMPEFSKSFHGLFQNGKPANLLYQRLEEALQQGSKVRIETNNDSFTGVPIELDGEFVEILALSVLEEEEEEETAFSRTTWLVRLSCIEAVAYSSEHWSKDRLENLLAGEDKED